MKVYGPYRRNDGRQHVIIKDGEYRRTVSYPKWLMEQRLGRELDPDEETINHINGDFNDNRWENLEILPRREHAKKDARRVPSLQLICLLCGSEFERRPNKERANRKQGKVGPFCGKSCAGKYGAEVQNGRWHGGVAE